MMLNDVFKYLLTAGGLLAYKMGFANVRTRMKKNKRKTHISTQNLTVLPSCMRITVVVMLKVQYIAACH